MECKDARLTAPGLLGRIDRPIGAAYRRATVRGVQASSRSPARPSRLPIATGNITGSASGSHSGRSFAAKRIARQSATRVSLLPMRAVRSISQNGSVHMASDQPSGCIRHLPDRAPLAKPSRAQSAGQSREICLLERRKGEWRSHLFS